MIMATLVRAEFVNQLGIEGTKQSFTVGAVWGGGDGTHRSGITTCTFTICTTYYKGKNNRVDQ